MKKHLVVLTGAGISAESGLQTFRNADGLWEGHLIEEVATPRGWRKNPGLVLDFYNQRRQNVLKARPNAAHHGLAALEKEFKVTIITQNIDDLHERAGSNNVIHLHGEILKMRSESDDTLIYPITGNIAVGDTGEDGRQLRPHIVWFEEPVPMIEAAVPLVEDADLFAVIGTSLVVYPAAGLIHYTRSGIPRYILDKKIPNVNEADGWELIEKPAAEGITDLMERIRIAYGQM